MTAPDPRLGEIEAAEALVHVKCADCGKCRTAEEDCWCPECEYWGCEQGPDCEDDTKPTDVAYLLAELRKRDEVIARVEGLADQWREQFAGSPSPLGAAIQQVINSIDDALEPTDVAAATGGAQ